MLSLLFYIINAITVISNRIYNNIYSTVTDLAKFLGLSISQLFNLATS